MSVNTYPPVSGGAGVPFSGLKLVTSGTNWTTNANQSHVWSVELQPGRYMVYANNDFTAISYKNSVQTSATKSDNPTTEIVLSTTDTVWFISGIRARGGTLGPYPNYPEVQYRYHNLNVNGAFMPTNATDYETSSTTTGYILTTANTNGFYAAFYDFSQRGLPDTPSVSQIASGTFDRVTYTGKLNNRYFAGVPNTSLWSSTDGINWTTATLTGATGVVQDINYLSANSTYVLTSCATNSAVVNTAILNSTDGVNWTTSTFAGTRAYTLSYGNGVMITGANDGNIYSSTDGINWTARTLPYAHKMYGSEYFDGYFYAFAQVDNANTSGGSTISRNAGLTTPSIARSTDGITWTAVGLYNSFVTESSSSTASYFPYIHGYFKEVGSNNIRIPTSSWVYNNTLYVYMWPGFVYGTTSGTSWFRSSSGNGQPPTIKNPDVGMLYLTAAYTSSVTGFSAMSVYEPDKVNYYIYSSQE